MHLAQDPVWRKPSGNKPMIQCGQEANVGHGVMQGTPVKGGDVTGSARVEPNTPGFVEINAKCLNQILQPMAGKVRSEQHRKLKRIDDRIRQAAKSGREESKVEASIMRHDWQVSQKGAHVSRYLVNAPAVPHRVSNVWKAFEAEFALDRIWNGNGRWIKVILATGNRLSSQESNRY